MISVLGEFTLPLGAPGNYAFSGDPERTGLLFLACDDGPRQVVGVVVEPDYQNGGISNPLTVLSPQQISQLRGVTLQSWSPELPQLLERLDARRCCVDLQLLGAGAASLSALPPLPHDLGYLLVNECTSPGYTDLSQVRRLKHLRTLHMQLMTLETLSGELFAGLPELESLKVSGATLDSPKSLVDLPRLRHLTVSLSGEVGILDFVGSLPTLESLDVSRSSLRDLSALGGHPKLRRVVANFCPIEKLPTEAMPALESLSALGLALEPAAVRAFEQANPGRLRYRYDQELRRALARAERVRVRSGGTCHREMQAEETLFESDQAQVVKELLDTIELQDEQGYVHCMCCGNPTLEFYRGDELLAMVGFHHGQLLRWAGGWPGDASLTSSSALALVDWLDRHGAPGPRLEREHQQEQASQFRQAWDTATEGLPDGVKQALAEYEPGSGDQSEALLDALEAAYPEPQQQIRAMLRVQGSGGPWNPSSMHEVAAEKALKSYSTEQLVATLEQALAGQNKRERRGAVRFWLRSGALNEPPGPEGVERVIEIMQACPSQQVRQYAPVVLQGWATPGLEPARFLRAAFNDSAEQVRRQAIITSGWLGVSSLTAELKAIVQGQAAAPEPVAGVSDYDYPDNVGGKSTEAELAQLALGLLGEPAQLPLLTSQPESPSRAVALALLGQTRHLKPQHFQQEDGNQELQLAAVEAVIRSRGRVGLSWALDYRESYSEGERVARRLAQMLVQEEAPGSEQLRDCDSLAQLKAWFAQHGRGFLESKNR